jgi:hypothetical protein
MTEKKPRVNSSSQKQLDEAEKQFEAFDQNIKDMTMDRMNAAPKPEAEPQTKMSQADIQKSNDVYLKPFKAIGSKEKFNEDYRNQYNFDKEYVQFIAENKEIIGETIELWTKPYAGMPAEFWQVPCNKPVWGPRYLAEQIKSKFYHRLVMRQNISAGADGMGQYYGSMAVDTTVQRLDAIPVSSRKSIFMGAKSF